MFSGVTDCYQPLEASFRLTRGCLEVCAEYRNPVGIITKAPLIERDIDVLRTLARDARVQRQRQHAVLGSRPARAHRALRGDAAAADEDHREAGRGAGIRVGVNVAPMIPGLGDEDMSSRCSTAARDAGATRAAYVLLRLPGSVKAVFEERVREALPAARREDAAPRPRDARRQAVRLALRRAGARRGPYADAIGVLFAAQARKVGLEPRWPDDARPDTFRRPERPGDQLALL